MKQASKRQREETENPVTVVNTPEETAVTPKEKAISYNNRQKEKVAFKLNYLNDKRVRYKSYYSFISCRQRKAIVPGGLKVYLEPSIDNHNEEFLNNWHERLESFSLTPMSNVLTFCKNTIKTISLEITKTQKN